jgi:signal transduction histidine kinase
MAMDADKASILVVDDEPSILLTLGEILRRDSYAVSCAGSGQEALAAIAACQFDLMLTDLKMNDVDGMAVVAEVRKRSPGTVALVMTGYGSIDTALQSLRLGAYDYLLKPVEVEELKLAVERALEHRRFSEIEVLYRAETEIAAAVDLDALEQAVAAAAQTGLGVEDVSLLVVGPNFEIELPPRLAPAVDRSQLARVFRGETATGCAADSVYALVPGVIAGRTVCVLMAESGQANYEFHPSAQRFMRGLAGHAALALDNMRLIAELRQNNHALTSANRKLKELDRLRTQFLGIATHELRTPLSVILGYNSLLAESLQDRLSTDESESLAESIFACKRLIKLVNSVLDVSQIESGRMAMCLTMADLRHSVQSVCGFFKKEAADKGIRLDMVLPARMPRVQFDPERFEQVLINLVDNAIKWTPAPGRVTVDLCYLASQKAVELRVSDTGVGISATDQELIFDEFVQLRRRMQGETRDGVTALPKQMTGTSRGSGLGLAIAKRIVEAHNGYLTVTSKPGSGSIFRLILPVLQPDSGAVSA